VVESQMLLLQVQWPMRIKEGNGMQHLLASSDGRVAVLASEQVPTYKLM
jgi:hypothetical protein